jgi:hypothetical protein
MNKWPRHPLFNRGVAVAMKAHYLSGYFESGQAFCPVLLEGHTLSQLLFRCARQRANVARRTRRLLPLFDAVQVKRFYGQRVVRQCELLGDVLGERA